MWIRGIEYWGWIERRGHNLPEIKDVPVDLPLAETEHPIDCPECRWRMVKYSVGHGVGFALDHCHGCKGIWLDMNEWEILKRRNLHDDLHSILTSFWQSEALKEDRRKRFEQRYIGKFGAEDYDEIKRVRAWLWAHPKKSELMAFLTDEDPLDT
jgi:Zn-finger nucleic acid-binding protein